MISLDELARIGGAELHGDGSVAISGFAGLESAGPGQISFAVGERWRAVAARSRASALVLEGPIEGFEGSQLLHPDPNLAFARMVAYVQHREAAADPGIHPAATVSSDARVDPAATIGPQAVIEAGASVGAGTVIDAHAYVGPRVRIGRDCRLRAGARVMADCRVGDRVHLQPNAVVGGDGFGYATDPEGRHVKIPQTGIVILEDDVEIGAGATIDRARFDETVIGRGTKIDNLVMVAHNVRIGPDCLLVAQSGIAGSTRLGSRAILGGHVGVKGHIEIGDDVRVAAYSGVSGNLKDGQAYFGIPAIPMSEGRRAAILHGRLPQLWKRIQELERRLAESEGTPGGESSE